MNSTLGEAQAAFDKIPMQTKLAAGLHHPQHEGRRVLPVLEATTLREIHSAIGQGEVVVIATMIGEGVEFGMFMREQLDELATGDPASLDMTMRQLIDLTQAQGAPLEPGSPLENPNL